MRLSAKWIVAALVTAMRIRRLDALPRLIVLSVMMLVAVMWASLFARAAPREGVSRGREVHAIWAHPPDIGANDEGIRRFLDHCQRANIDTIVLLVKGMSGEIYWKSRRFPQAIAKGYESYDFLGRLTSEAHARGMKVDAWLCDFPEGVHGAAYQQHPEWAQLNPDGGTTATEKLGQTRSYDYVWMCPARRPGYVDQWLIPMFEEVASNYPVDSVHNDYVRYPGDVAPDSYCFCDYCLAHLPKYAMLRYETGSTSERYYVRAAQPRIEANWWTDPTMLPADWEQLNRREKADYILNGRTIPGGPPDMRYIFYDYRASRIENFVRELAEHIHAINPKTEVSASVFKNPILSGRFLGQHWNEWTQWIDVFMPMTYRSHFAGDFQSYLDHLTEVTARQLEWIHHAKPLYAGIASTYLYREELQPLDDIRASIAELKNLPPIETTAHIEGALIVNTDIERARAANTAKRAALSRAINTSHAAMRERLTKTAPEREREIGNLVRAITAEDGRDATPAALDNLDTQILKLRRDLPPAFLPPEKLTRAIEAARRAQPDGIAIFSAGNLTREKLWPTLEAAFKR